MPFEIRKQGNKYRLYNLDKKKYAKTSFNSKQSAKKQANNWMRRDKKK